MSSPIDSTSDHKTRRFLEGVRKRCPDNLMVLETLGDLYTRQGQYEEGLAIDLLLTSRFPDNEMYWYNLACSFSLTGKVEQALDAIKKSVNLGYDNVEWLLKDKDLAAIKHHPDVVALITTIKAKTI